MGWVNDSLYACRSWRVATWAWLADQVQINEVGGTHTLIIELKVEKSDIGKIIGKKGKTINAIRTLLMSVASRNGLRVNLEILEDEVKQEA